MENLVIKPCKTIMSAFTLKMIAIMDIPYILSTAFVDNRTNKIWN